MQVLPQLNGLGSRVDVCIRLVSTRCVCTMQPMASPSQETAFFELRCVAVLEAEVDLSKAFKFRDRSLAICVGMILWLVRGHVLPIQFVAR